MREDMGAEQRMRPGGRGLALDGDKGAFRCSCWSARGGRKLGGVSDMGSEGVKVVRGGICICY